MFTPFRGQGAQRWQAYREPQRVPFFKKTISGSELLYLDCKNISMKRKLILSASFLFFAIAFNSCESGSGCGYCKDVTYENNAVVNESAETEYCGDDLINKKATAPVVVGTLTTKVECR
jgi:hypothetical protein